MSKITWEQHPDFDNRIVAINDGAHVAWIVAINFGGHTSYVVKSWIRHLNGVQFTTQEKAQAWVESQLEGMSIDKNVELAGSTNLRIADLDRVKHLVKVKKLAELADLNASTIAQKVSRGTELTVAESEAMTKVLTDVGLIVRGQRPPQT
jgi:hypothetical protein